MSSTDVGRCTKTRIMKKSAQRDANTVCALTVVRFGHRPLSQTHRQDRLQYTALQLASAKCNKLFCNKLVMPLRPIEPGLASISRFFNCCLMSPVSITFILYYIFSNFNPHSSPLCYVTTNHWTFIFKCTEFSNLEQLSHLCYLCPASTFITL